MSSNNTVYRYYYCLGEWTIDAFYLPNVIKEIDESSRGYTKQKNGKEIYKVWLKEEISLEIFKLNLLLGIYDA